ncbi:hypothetical protein AEM51_00780 [Bacteroidetes bacterium UKL13-3]|nr:hypothetical protein AEM51_00780 [Bacteroidetes bacterium UKL13-3]HCP93521.1 hypothetical protein [Bacteroidota bacterium]
MKQVLTVLLFLVTYLCVAQTAQLEIEMTNNLGDAHKNIRVSLKDVSTGKTQVGFTSKSGLVRFFVERNKTYEIKPDNYFQTFTEQIGHQNILLHTVKYSYNASPDNPELKHKLPPLLLGELNKITNALKDSSLNKRPEKGQEVLFAHLRVQISYFNKSIEYEKLFFTISRLRKTIIAYTDSMGKADIYLPKGDTIQLHFTYDRNYRTFYYYPSLMEHLTDLEIEYIGTKNLEKLAKEKEERMKRERERLEKERLAFEERLKHEHLTRKEGVKRSFNQPSKGKLFANIFSRNKWGRKLMVVDVTGSMDPYVSELLLWLKLNFEKEKGIQFVFFNDGDGKSDELKKPGKTGGVYYVKPKTYNELLDVASAVAAKGSGGDAPENNIEALMKAMQLASEYDEIVMVADSYAAINDMELIQHLIKPVRIVLCGIEDHLFVEPDYLVLAWKSKGSIHSIEKDIDSIAKMMDGKIITLFGKDYRLLNGRFIPVNHL